RIEVSTAEPTEGAVLTYLDALHATLPTICLQDIAFAPPLVLEDRPSAVPAIQEVNRADLNYFLNYIFGHDELRDGQYEAVARALTGKDAIVLLPTAHGKSIAFQLAAML